jgi:hypothetical protein
LRAFDKLVKVIRQYTQFIIGNNIEAAGSFADSQQTCCIHYVADGFYRPDQQELRRNKYCDNRGGDDDDLHNYGVSCV